VPKTVYLPLLETTMTTNIPNTDSHLNSINLSLHEFLGEPWENLNTSQPNTVALEMLLVDNDDNIPTSDKNNEKETDEKPFIRRRDNKVSLTTKEVALAEARQKGKYITLTKLSYPALWYGIRTSQAVLNAGFKRAYHITGIGYRSIYLLGDFVWLLLTPFRRLFDVLIGDEYQRAKRAMRSRVHRNRLWLGRSRGYTYISAFYHRCRYIVSYFNVHQFYQIELFLRNTLTIRRGIQAIIPVGLFCSVVYKAIFVPRLVDTRGSHGLENTTKRLSARPVETLTQIFIADENYSLDLDNELTRAESGLLFNRDTHLVNEFVTGAYAEVEKTTVGEVIHPNEVFTYLEMGSPDKTDQFSPKNNKRKVSIGKYEISPDEVDQIPDPDPPAPGEEEKDEETKLAEAEAVRASFIPEHRYKVLREEDDNLLEQYTVAEKVRKYRTHKKKRLAYKQNPSRNVYVDSMPHVQPQRIESEQKRAKQKSEHIRAIVNDLEVTESVATNIPWINEFIRVIDWSNSVFPNMNFEPWDTKIANIFDTPESHIRAVLSPFGITTDIGVVDELKPYSKYETKIFPYSFKDSRSLLNAIGAGNKDTDAHEGIKYVLALFHEPAEFAEAVLDWSLDRWEMGDTQFNFDEEEDDLEENNDEDDGVEGLDEEAEDLDDEEDDFEEEENDLEDEENEEEDANGMPSNDEEEENNDDLSEENEIDNGYQIDEYQKQTVGAEKEPEVGSPVPLWKPHVTLFISPTPATPWQSMVWNSVALQLMMYASIEFCIRLECRGFRVRLKPLPNVHRMIPHIGRLPEGVQVREYVGETMNTVQVRKLLLAFQARRGAELYGHSQWTKLWNLVIRPNVSASQAIWIDTKKREWGKKLSSIFSAQVDQGGPAVLLSRNVSQYSGLPKTVTLDIEPRYFGFDKVTEAIQSYIHPKTSDGKPLTPPLLAERQQFLNRLGGETTIEQGLAYGKTIQEEICHFPLFALIKPGTQRMNRLPKGMILLGDPGNGRTYFVRTLATESRLPLLITESNRYLDQSLGLVRLKTLFKRVRGQAPNILFIRDMDFMTRHRERYPMFTSVRATTQLLMAIDGYSRGTETVPSEQDVFVIGSMTTTIMMDDACMRSGRFEWLLNFYYPPVKERHNMLMLHSTKSIVNKTANVDWNYFTAMTNGFSCLDIRTIVNTSAIHALRQNSTLHTTESVAFALGAVNHIHDLPEVTFNSAGVTSFFLRAEYAQRENNIAQYAPFFTQTGHVPMYKKVMHIFKTMALSETQTITERWSLQQSDQRTYVDVEPDRTLVSGLLPLLCEGLFLYNTQKMCGSPYPIITFDTYCSPLFFEMKNMMDDVSLEHTLERVTKENLFITTFDLWRRSHPNNWTPTGLFDSKAIAMRTNSTTMWRSTRFSKKYSVIGGLTELEGEILWGPPPIATKIKNRISFIGENTPEFGSRDPVLFGTFETHSDLAFKCRKETTARRIHQVSMEILDVMQKHWC